MDMRSPGVEIRPIRQIDGGNEFNEVFMTDVKVPVANLLGKEGQGWEVVSSALVNERSGIAGSIRGDQALDWLITTTREPGQDGAIRTSASASPTSPSRARSCATRACARSPTR